MEAHLSGADSSLNATVNIDEDLQFQDLLADDGPNPEDVTAAQIDGETRSKWLHDALDTLSERERRIISRRFLDDDKSTLAEIGESFGVSKERIRQIEAKALDKLRAELEQHAADPGELLSLNLMQ